MAHAPVYVLASIAKLNRGLNVCEVMHFRTPSVNGKASGNESGIAREKAQVLLDGHAQRKVHFVAQIAPETAQRVRAEHATRRAFPRPARGCQQKMVVIQLQSEFRMQRRSASDTEIVHVSQAH